MKKSINTQKWMILVMMITLDVVLSPLFRIEGMAPMSSLMNVSAAVLMGPFYGTLMALACAILRMMLLGIPPLALTGALFGAFLAGLGYRLTKKVWGAMLGEFIGTGLIGSLLSYPVMVWFTGSHTGLFWFVYTPRFIGGATIGSILALLLLVKLQHLSIFKQSQAIFTEEADS